MEVKVAEEEGEGASSVVDEEERIASLTVGEAVTRGTSNVVTIRTESSAGATATSIAAVTRTASAVSFLAVTIATVIAWKNVFSTFKEED